MTLLKIIIIFVKKCTRGEHNFHSSVRGKRDGIELVYAYIREDD